MPDPIAFVIFGFEVRWYGVLIALAMMIGILIAIKRASKKNIIADHILDILIVSIPCAILGARLYYVTFSLDYYLAYPEQIFAIWLGGLAIHGGLIGAFIGGYIVCRIKKLNFIMILDIFAPCFPLGQAIGRWGNYLNQEAYGSETNLPWAITVTDPLKGIIKVHPTFLYESISNIIIFFFILFYERKFKKTDGELICIYAILYSCVRFFIEGLRTDSLYFYNFRIAQLISIALIILGLTFLVILRKNHINKD